MTPQQSYGASSTARIRGRSPLITPAIHPLSKLRGILAFFITIVVTSTFRLRKERLLCANVGW